MAYLGRNNDWLALVDWLVKTLYLVQVHGLYAVQNARFKLEAWLAVGHLKAGVISYHTGQMVIGYRTVRYYLIVFVVDAVRSVARHVGRDGWFVVYLMDSLRLWLTANWTSRRLVLRQRI